MYYDGICAYNITLYCELIVKNKKRALIGLTIIIALLAGIFLYSYYDPEKYLLFPKCPVYTLTGYQCPGCGSQRAFHNFFHGNFLTAFRYNPIMLLLIPYVMLGVYIEYIANRFNPRITNIRNIFFGKWAVLIIALIIISFTIYRNT